MAKLDSAKIILEDGSKWKTWPFKNSDGVNFWFEDALIKIIPGRTKDIITYHLKNLDENDTVQGCFLGFEKPPYKFPITK